MEGAGIHDDQWKRYPRKPVTFPTPEKMEEATLYCRRKGIGFSELVRKLLAEHMRREQQGHPDEAPTCIRVIKEPER